MVPRAGALLIGGSIIRENQLGSRCQKHERPHWPNETELSRPALGGREASVARGLWRVVVVVCFTPALTVSIQLA
jgi:hypothetical protein